MAATTRCCGDDNNIHTIDDGTGALRRRSSPVVNSSSSNNNNHDPLLVHSFSESSFSRVTASATSAAIANDDDSPSSSSAASSVTRPGGNGSNNATNNNNNHHHHHFSVKGIASSTFLLKRLSRSSSLSWGHKPSPYIGASCLFYLLPVPFFLRACAYHSAMALLLVSISSYMSDHVYTGLESYAHAADRMLAPLAFFSCLYSTCADCGHVWAASSLLAVQCHVRANYYARKGMYDEFVLWHCLWHGVGVGLIVFCYWWNDVVGSCWTTTNHHHQENALLMWWLREE